ncbi:signal peptidase containing protein [Cyclospora cayetanensis]|uniref:Signal peptidase containing protein n=1 Tax=Cyclospora cayetanensis TaxID=88456 RepID=A0A1D3D1I4_9EIME|nr:signal peptidase containing protein [Cyclospora cayetanensis]
MQLHRSVTRPLCSKSPLQPQQEWRSMPFFLEACHVTFSPEPPRVVSDVLDCLHVEFDDLPPEEIPDLEETRHSLFGPSDGEEEEAGQKQEGRDDVATAIAAAKEQQGGEETSEEEEHDEWTLSSAARERSETSPACRTPRRTGTGWAPRSGLLPPSSSESSRASSIERPQVLQEAEQQSQSEGTQQQEGKRAAADVFLRLVADAPSIQLTTVDDAPPTYSQDEREDQKHLARAGGRSVSLPLHSSSARKSLSSGPMLPGTGCLRSASAYSAASSKSRGSTSSSFGSRFFRRFSVDEGPPPSGYTEETLPTPRELLSHSSAELASDMHVLSPTEAAGEETHDDPDIHIVVSGISVDVEKMLNRHRSADHGPPPRGFFVCETPSAKELLSLHLDMNLEEGAEEDTVSAREGGTPEEDESEAEEADEAEAEAEGDEEADETLEQQELLEAQRQQQPKMPKQQQLPRGRRSKEKRAQKKYADQDEEERAQRMKLIASAGESARSREAAAAAQRTAEAQRRKKERHEWKSMLHHMQGEEPPPAAADFAERLSQLDLLTANPTPEDSIIAAVPMVAPFSALQASSASWLGPFFSCKLRLSPARLSLPHTHTPSDTSSWQFSLKPCVVQRSRGKT